MNREQKRQRLKELLMKHGNWEIDICPTEPRDSEVLLKVIEEFNKAISEKG